MEDDVSILTDLTTDDVGVNVAYFTVCFDGIIIEDGVAD